MDLVATSQPPPADGSGGADPPRPLGHLSDQALEDRLAGLAGRIAAAQAGFLAHVLELDLRGMWGDQGAKSAAQWLSWRLGLGIGTAREHVRVARALLGLPAVGAAFAEGQLSYCKVRALTRVGTADNEAELLEVALGCTGSQLERSLRAYRSVFRVEDSASATLRRGLGRRVLGDGSVLYTLRVPPEDAPSVDKALDIAVRVVLDDHGNPIETPEETRLADAIGADPPIVRARADALVLIAESFVATGPVGDRGDGMEVLLHADMDDLADLVRDNPAQDGPAVGDPHEDPVAEDPVAEDPAAENAHGDDPGAPRGAPSRPTRTRSADGQPLLSTTALRRLCETSVRLMAHAPDGYPIDLGRTARDASPRQRRVLHERDQHCRFPGCTQRRRLIPHHVIWWSRGGPTDMDNLVLLCPAHHRAVHEVGYQVVAHGHGRFSFYNPVGRPLDATGRIEDPPEDQPGWPRTPWRPAPMPAWGGEPLNIAYLIDGMAANATIAAARAAA